MRVICATTYARKIKNNVFFNVYTYSTPCSIDIQFCSLSLDLVLQAKNKLG